MPESNPAGQKELKEKLKNLKTVFTILDVGPGVGTYKDLLNDIFPRAYWIGCEVWHPYIAQYKLEKKYDLLLAGDIKNMPLMYGLDLIIFGDVLEHMSAPDAVRVYNHFRRSTKYTVISIPIVNYPQGPLFGNPYETHMSQWSHSSILSNFKGTRLLWKDNKKGYYLALKEKKK